MNRPKRWLDDDNTSSELRELMRAGSRPPHFPKLALAATVIPLAQKAALASTWSWPAGAVIAAKATTLGMVIGFGSVAVVTSLSGHAPTTASSASGITGKPRSVNGFERTRATALPSEPTRVRPTSPASQAASHEPDAPTDARHEPMPAASQAVRNDANSTAHAASAHAPAAPGHGDGTAAPATPDGRVNAANAPSGIAAEANLLERARALLDESPARALLLTVEHRERFPSGQMAAERELLAIDALLRLGRSDEAQRRATPYLADSANEVFATRVRRLLERRAR